MAKYKMFHKIFRFNVIPILADILSESAKEKVTRIILAMFRVNAFFIFFLCTNEVLDFLNFVESHRKTRGDDHLQGACNRHGAMQSSQAAGHSGRKEVRR